jgi:hypothetical protein
MPKLCEIVAVLKGVKSRAYGLITEHDKLCQKPALFNGMVKQYEPINEDDTDRPDGETVLVQNSTDDVISDMRRLLAEYIDITMTQEAGNTKAFADIEVDGDVLAKDVPATVLLFLEKQLTDLQTAVSRLPVLSPEYNWSRDEARGCWTSDTVKKVRTKKTPRVIMTTTSKTTGKDGSVTEEQTGQVVSEDLPVGYWHTTYFSKALLPERRRDLSDRIVKLQRAVKQARERANSTVVEHQKLGVALLGWVFR